MATDAQPRNAAADAPENGAVRPLRFDLCQGPLPQRVFN